MREEKGIKLRALNLSWPVSSLKVIGSLGNLPLDGVALSPVIRILIRNIFPRIENLSVGVQNYILTRLGMIKMIMASDYSRPGAKMIKLGHAVSITAHAPIGQRFVVSARLMPSLARRQDKVADPGK